MNIAAIDKNLKLESKIERDDLIWIEATSDLFRIYGAGQLSPFLRMPEDFAKSVNGNIAALNHHTSGIRLRLRTDSSFIAIHAEWGGMTKMSHMPFSGSSGFDIYRIVDGEQRFAGAYIPKMDSDKGFESLLGAAGVMTDYVIDFPLYNGVSKLYIGVKNTATFEDPAEYSLKDPIVFYGSSITQGGCASRPGNSYSAMLSRRFDADFINLGFSGNAKGEPEMAEYISNLKMSAFIYDYDYNAPNIEHLEKTHYPFFKIIRDKNPTLPIIILSRPGYKHNANTLAWKNVIMATYEKAKNDGDQNVYFVDGAEIYKGDLRDSMSVDGCHPTDLGFYGFYETLKPILEKIL